MIQQKQSVQSDGALIILNSCQEKTLRLLWEAWSSACSAGVDVWQFALEIEQLRILGLSHNDLRYLLYWGYLDHARERTTARMGQRLFQPLHSLVLPKRTCFVLTAKGREAVSELTTPRNGIVASAGEPISLPHSRPPVPRWDNDARRLWWQDRLIKEFRRPAVNQELILAVFQEESWPKRIDDPLPQIADIDPKVRIHDAIKKLNSHHLYRILRFRGDGNGRGIEWYTGESG
jgi:hypothetical protein